MAKGRNMSDEAVEPRANINMLVGVLRMDFLSNVQILPKIVSSRGTSGVSSVEEARIQCQPRCLCRSIISEPCIPSQRLDEPRDIPQRTEKLAHIDSEQL